MQALIKQVFLNRDEFAREVVDGWYDLVGPNGEIILPSVWREVIQPGWEIKMQMWPVGADTVVSVSNQVVRRSGIPEFPRAPATTSDQDSDPPPLPPASPTKPDKLKLFSWVTGKRPLHDYDDDMRTTTASHYYRDDATRPSLGYTTAVPSLAYGPETAPSPYYGRENDTRATTASHYRRDNSTRPSLVRTTAVPSARYGADKTPSLHYGRDADAASVAQKPVDLSWDMDRSPGTSRSSSRPAASDYDSDAEIPDRNLDRSYDRSYGRGYDRDRDRSYDRGGYGRSYDRSHERRSLKRSETIRTTSAPGPLIIVPRNRPPLHVPQTPFRPPLRRQTIKTLDKVVCAPWEMQIMSARVYPDELTTAGAISLELVGSVKAPGPATVGSVKPPATAPAGIKAQNQGNQKHTTWL